MNIFFLVLHFKKLCIFFLNEILNNVAPYTPWIREKNLNNFCQKY